MYAYVIGAMVKHIIRIVISTVFLTNTKRKEYDVRLVKVNAKEVTASAAFIGVIFFSITIFLVVYIKGSNMMITVAGIIISIGFAQQLVSIGIDAISTNFNNFISTWNSVIYMLSRIRRGDEWRHIEEESSRIFIYPHIIYSLPESINEPKISTSRLIKYIQEHQHEVDYPHHVYDFEPSLLSFSQYLIDYLNSRLVLLDTIMDIQHRASNVNPILFLAIGGIIWLLA